MSDGKIRCVVRVESSVISETKRYYQLVDAWAPQDVLAKGMDFSKQKGHEDQLVTMVNIDCVGPNFSACEEAVTRRLQHTFGNGPGLDFWVKAFDWK